MNDAITKLTTLASMPIRAELVNHEQLEHYLDKRTANELQLLLQMKNGFYAFEGALHVFADFGNANEKGLLEWNQDDLWRKYYEGMAENAVFFAEDVFGTQFCIRNGQIATFDPETAAFETIAVNIKEWAQLILDDYEFWTGYKIAHDWQMQYGPIPIGRRLVPTTPFVLGGSYSVANVRAIDAIEGMNYRASIAVQIRDLPDGTQVTLRVID